jgi:excisionase family DNA binding protein
MVRLPRQFWIVKEDSPGGAVLSGRQQGMLQHDEVPGLLTESQVYTPKEIADTLRVSAVTISRAIREGKLKAFRVGGQWRIYGSEIRAYVEAETARALNA